MCDSLLGVLIHPFSPKCLLIVCLLLVVCLTPGKRVKACWPSRAWLPRGCCQAECWLEAARPYKVVMMLCAGREVLQMDQGMLHSGADSIHCACGGFFLLFQVCLCSWWAWQIQDPWWVVADEEHEQDKRCRRFFLVENSGPFLSAFLKQYGTNSYYKYNSITIRSIDVLNALPL